RYTYLPHVGLFAAAVFGGWELLVPRLLSPIARGAAAAAVGVALLALAAASFAQTRVWRDADTLFAPSLPLTSHNTVLRPGIAAGYQGIGRIRDAERVLEEER